MQLKKLNLLGFKTFADKTEIQIDNGLTAIVGPNGSGKSNIVDALLWVLGEQNPKHLRGSSAQDVIFNGTDKRKPLGMAEVKLTVDNSDGTLPVAYKEVTITRRIYRSGESNYLINNIPCRLKDIVELFLDTGVGKGAYAFVSQSEIDAVLSAKPEDRRELFEEAAGIKKYRVKKREALRKLENAEANLSRVRDILIELEEQRGPMEKQALTARRYLQLQERLHEIEVGMLIAELQKADYELYAGKRERDEDQATLLKLETELTTLESHATELAEKTAVAEEALEEARQNRQQTFSKSERTESQLSLMVERSRMANKSQEELGQELEALTQRIRALRVQIESDREEKDETEAEEAKRREEWAAQRGELTELDQATQTVARQADARQAERLKLAQERAGREAALRAAQERINEAKPRSDRLTREVAELSNSLLETQERENAAKLRKQERRQERETIALQRSEAEASYRETQNVIVSHRQKLETERRTLAEQSARLSTLTELQENHEGFYQGVRAVLQAEKRKQISGHFKAVVDLLTVPENYRVAVEVALGGSLQDIVTETEAEAKAGIEWLKRNRAGRATFLALPLLRPGQRISPPAGQSEIQAAIELIGYDPKYSQVIQLLLGRVLIVPDMDSAIAASRRLTGWSKIVTQEGEQLSPGGALTGGSLQGKGAHLVGRKGEMDDLKSRLPKIRAEVERVAGQLEANQIALQSLELERDELAKMESAVAAELASLESSLAAIEREHTRLLRDRAERDSSLSALSAQVGVLNEQALRLSNELTRGAEENETADDALAALIEETRNLTQKRDACRSKAVTLEVDVSRLKEKREGITRALAVDRATLSGLEMQHLQKGSQRANSATEGAEALAERERLAAILVETKLSLEKADSELQKTTEAKQALVAANFTTNSSIRERIQRRSEVTKSLHENELRLARLEIQLSQVTERLQEEYSISKEEGLKRPEETNVDKNTAMEVSRLRREIRAMGQVNTGAVDEYDRLTERFDNLNEQKADIDKGREALLSTIAEIDDSTRGVFMETFEAVRTEFDRLFQRLFDGGTTKLILTDPNDVLETGIEVIAQPPGKKAQSLSLLSGGERALTATALLFAFLAVKPSPFVLLDEVDAPLDGANVEKFTNLVKEFSVKSQFLLITHNPTTMEAAPTWYGVSMREAGVSSILSYRVPQEATQSVIEEGVVLTETVGK